MGKNRRTAALWILATATVCTVAGGAASEPGPVDLLQQALTDLRENRLEQADKAAVLAATAGKQPLAEGWLVAGDARRRQGQHASAVRAYRMFLASSARDDLRQYALDMVQACQSAMEIAPPPPPAAEKLTDEQKTDLAKVDEKFYKETSEHFVVRARNAKLAALIAQRAEADLRRICGVILAGQEYPHVVEIQLWPDHREYAASAPAGQDWSGGSYSIGTDKGVVTRRIDLTQNDQFGSFAVDTLDRVLPHEMCHLVLKEFFGDASCPLFLNEGLAMLAEERIDNERLELAGAALGGDEKFDMDGFLARQRYDRQDSQAVFYAESFSFCRYLHSRLSRAQFRSFLQNVKDGCAIADAVQRAAACAPDENFQTALAAAWRDNAIAVAQEIKALRAQATR